MIITARIIGTLVGPIWWPVGAVCTKPVNYSVSDAEVLGVKMSLRDHMLRVTNDGDFQHCALGDGVLEVTTTRYVGSNAVVRRTRVFDLKLFPGIQDMLTDEVPCYEEAA